jgi:uncharacterized protein YoxC
MNHETLELVFVGIAALALLTQTVILLAILIGIGKAAKSAKEEIQEIKSTVMPVVENTRDLIARLSPKVESTIGDASELVHLLRTQAQDVESSVEQILMSVRTQGARIDNMFSGTLDAVDKASDFVTKVVSKPVRQISGVLASIKAFIETMGSENPVNSSYPDVEPQDDNKDMFV